MTGSVAEQSPNWFAIPGEQNGRRSIDEQMLGLQPALERSKGKDVADFGCAEGCIALEFARAGANVWACDYNAAMIETAKVLAAGMRGIAFEQADIRDVIRKRRGVHFDIVLALAILHKLNDPREGLEYFADCARELVVIRLPHWHADGIIRAKHGGQVCNVTAVMERRGFVLEAVLAGPRQEPVCYWRRRT